MWDAVEAERGGADRLEIVRDLDREGLTPSLSLVREIRKEVAIPCRVMLRHQESHMLTDRRDLQEYARLAGEFAAAGVDGFVFGFVRDEAIDVEAAGALLTYLHPINAKATFHRAFDATADCIAAIAALKKCAGVDRILTGGGSGPWALKAQRLSQFCALARPEITIIAGGGLDAWAIRLLVERTPVQEFHTGRAVRDSAQPTGRVQAALVSELARIVHSTEELSGPSQLKE